MAKKKVEIHAPQKLDLAGGGKIKPKKIDLAQTLNAPEVENPLDEVDYTGELEHDANAEVSALLTGFRERARQEQDRFTLATDSEFWFAVGFKSREQKEAFLTAVGWDEHGDKYLNGVNIAQALGIPLPPVALTDATRKQVDRRLKELT